MRIFIAAVIFIFGIIVGYWVSLKNMRVNSGKGFSEIRGGGKYSYINPLLECEGSEETIQSMIQPFRETINASIENFKNDRKQVELVSVYFRDLNNGPWFSINTNQDFSPASLLKVPVLIAHLKRAEKDSSYLTKKVTHLAPPPSIYPQAIGSKESLVVGKEYTVDEILRTMIAKSSNEAAYDLTQSLNPGELDQVYSDLVVTANKDERGNRIVSVRTYASFFRILFNASYLDRTYSEYALGLLAESEFTDGIVAGVPKDILVSHKFGERSTEGIPARQLHDCGIVYYPNHPYLLCVMTRGKDFQAQAEVISDISKKVYEEVGKQISSLAK